MAEIVNTSNYRSRKYLMISSQIQISSSKNEIWKALTKNQHLLFFNPFIKNQDAGIVNSQGYKDSCIYYNDKKLFREVVEFKDGDKIKYRINFERQNHNNFTTFEAIEKNNLPYFKLTMESDSYKNVPRPIWHFLAYFIIIPSYRKYLNAVVKGMEYYLNSGEKVKKNQFGLHSQFSKK